jgi:hypothetical protein
LNRLDGSANDKGNGISANARGSYLLHNKGNWPVVKFSAEATYYKELSKSGWNNLVSYFDSGVNSYQEQFRNELTENQNYSFDVGVVRSLGKGFYLEPSVNIGTDNQQLNRKQSLQPQEVGVIDSLSPDFSRQYSWMRPGISLQKSSKKKQMNLGVDVESGLLLTTNYVFVLPSLNWQNEYGNSKRINFNYTSDINAPTAEQLMPVVNNANPVQRYIGNSTLRPEYAHNVRLGWLWFDQFSFTSLFTNISGRYTHDKVNVARIINADLTQVISPVNTSDNYKADARIELSRPVRKLGITVDFSINEGYERGISPINNIANTTDVFNHTARISFGNRKKEKWDVQVGGSIELSDIHYSVNKALNNSFNNTSAFTELSYRPTDKWYFMASADVTRYNSNSFSQSVTVPLVKSEASYYFLKANRGVLSLEGYDLLNQNKGLQRVGELNFYRETRSNVLGRYFMLSFKYRLNKLGGGGEKLDIQVKK